MIMTMMMLLVPKTTAFQMMGPMTTMHHGAMRRVPIVEAAPISPDSLLEQAKQLREEAAELEKGLALETFSKKQAELDAFFKKADANADGFVTLEELKTALMTTFVEASTSVRGQERAAQLVKETRVADLLKDLDVNADGRLDRSELTLGVDEMKRRLEESWNDERNAVQLEQQLRESQALATSNVDVYEGVANQTDAAARLVSMAAYLLPLFDALPFSLPPPGGADTAVAHVVAQAAGLYHAVPFSGLLAIIALNFVASDASASRLARFSARHAILLDLVAVFPLQLYALVQPGNAFVPGTALEAFVLASTVAAVFGANAGFIPGTGRLAKQYIDNFDNSVKAFLTSASAADLSKFFGGDDDDSSTTTKKKTRGEDSDKTDNN